MRRQGRQQYPSSGYNWLAATIVAMTCCLLICVFISYHSYFQLGFESDNARLFINNKVNGFEKELSALLTELDGQPASPGTQLSSIIPQTSVALRPPHHKLSCAHGELLTFWKPCTESDMKYVSPFKNYGPKEKYVTFEPGNIGFSPFIYIIYIC